MSIRKKGRRKIVCSDKLYIWYVDLDYDSPEYLLNIVAEDKSLILTCPLNEEYPYIVSKGKVFQNQNMDGVYHRYLLPFDVPKSITPKFVAALIQWGTQEKDAREVS